MSLRQVGRRIIVKTLSPFGDMFLSNSKSETSVRILTYHNVGFNRTGLTVEPEQFQAQLRWLAEHDYQVINLDRLERWIRGECDLTAKSVVITFDDGFEDVYWHVFPVLQQYGWTATFFIVPSWVDRNQGRQRILKWEQVKDMHLSGMQFGSHTHTHRLLCRVSRATMRDEIVRSKAIIEQNLGESISYFCYPSGYYDKSGMEEVRRAGYKLACSTRPGANCKYAHPLILRRTEISVRDNIHDFAQKLDGVFDIATSVYWGYRKVAQAIGLNK